MLTGKYLKYKPEITFEIFQKILDKLIENGWSCVADSKCKEEYESFKNQRYLGQSSIPMYFNSYYFSSGEKTTVEEILGYNPFEFVLPEKWCIKITDENESTLKNWWLKQDFNHSYGFRGLLCPKYDSSGLHYGDASGFERITFDQFKQYVLCSDKNLVPLPGFDN